MIVIGNRPYHELELDDILDGFDENTRINLGFPLKNNGTKVHTQYLNVHVFQNIKQKEDLTKKYQIANMDHIKMFQEFFKTNHYKKIVKQDLRKNNFYNNYLKSIKCPYTFKRLPRLGIFAILDMIIAYKTVIYVSHFSLHYIDNKKHTYIVSNNKYNYEEACKKSHDTKIEYDVIQWLHNNKYIDATLCALEDSELPTIDCSRIKPSNFIIKLLLKKFGICILKNYFTKTQIENFGKGFDEVFEKAKKDIEVRTIEGCSNDERIFHAEKFSSLINAFSNETLFNDCAQMYKQRLNKKTLLNKITYEEGKIKNSGAGWHRDNHECQFKALMYLTDVNITNGNFQFLTNSSKRFIGLPKPRTTNYNTRYHDETIEKLIDTNENIRLHNIVGVAGTVILADTTYIHRGNIIEEGERKAITQYFF